MAETLETIRTRMQSWLSMNTTRLPNAIATDCINLVQRSLCRRHDLRFFEYSDTMATVIGTQTYAVPSNWSRPYRLSWWDSETSTTVELVNKSKEELDRLFPDPTRTGKPAYYTLWGGLIYLGYTPDRVVTINRTYYRFLPDLADGNPNNTNDLCTFAWDILFFGALVEATGYGFEDTRMPLWEAKYRALEADLVSEHARAWSSGRVQQSEEP